MNSRIVSGSGTARTVKLTTENELDPWTVPRGSLGFLGGGISGALIAVSRNGTIGSDGWISMFAKRSLRSFKHRYEHISQKAIYNSQSRKDSPQDAARQQ